MPRQCLSCEVDDGGSCCGAGLEDKYDGVLLLLNLLLGVRLPRKRFESRSCYFLGEKGCLLLARHVICVNYLCRRITERVDPQRIASLRTKEGAELELLFHLYEGIRKLMKKSEG